MWSIRDQYWGHPPGHGVVDEVDQHQSCGGAEHSCELGEEHEEGAQWGAWAWALWGQGGAGPIQHEAQVLQEVDDEEEEDQKIDNCRLPANTLSFNFQDNWYVTTGFVKYRIQLANPISHLNKYSLSEVKISGNTWTLVPASCWHAFSNFSL